jgi:hypothetical protein
MSKKILQINYKVTVPVAELGGAMEKTARAIADVPGLAWKIWLLDEAKAEAGGIYLFDNDAAIDAFLAGPIIGELKSTPAFADVSVKRFAAVGPLTAITRGPIR